jgi:GDP/UDP-N,N'-diacetylbacillosamine 2-epimerase (hydrolysing)
MKIDFFSGKRGGFGAMLPLIKNLTEQPAYNVNLIVSDQHLDPEFGQTINEVRKHAINVVECKMGGQSGDAPAQRIAKLSTMSANLAHYFESREPDILFVYGDRTETLFAASAAMIMNIPIAHMQGGDRSGSVDDIIRHAITKLASLHYVSCEDSEERVAKLGEDRNRIVCVGDSHVDAVVQSSITSKDAVLQKLGISDVESYCVLLQHPETTDHGSSAYQIKETISAISSTKTTAIAIYPCSDPGHTAIISELEKSVDDGILRKTFKNLEFEDFLNLCRHATFIIGNSSSGIIESAYLGIPAINIGRRQINRIDGGNVIHVEHDALEIANQIALLKDHKFRSKLMKESALVYGDGYSYRKILDDLSNRDLSALLPKYISY